jgi:hypothetical protein
MHSLALHTELFDETPNNRKSANVERAGHGVEIMDKILEHMARNAMSAATKSLALQICDCWKE